MTKGNVILHTPPSLNERDWLETAARLKLSRRELAVIECISQLCDDELSIAAALQMSRHTVHTHLERLYRKLHVNNRCQLMVRVLLAYTDVVRANSGRETERAS